MHEIALLCPRQQNDAKFRGKAESIHEEAEQRNDDVHVHVPHVHALPCQVLSSAFRILFDGVTPQPIVYTQRKVKKTFRCFCFPKSFDGLVFYFAEKERVE